MKKKVVLSNYSKVMTIIAMAIIVGLFVYEIRIERDWRAWMIGILFVAIVFSTMFYAPTSIIVDSKCLIIKRLLKSKVIDIDDVESIELIQPTMGARRLMGSGGWMGYWGWFSERDLGRYFAYYGKSSDCFLVKLKSGRQYMLGCEDPDEVVEYVKRLIKK